MRLRHLNITLAILVCYLPLYAQLQDKEVLFKTITTEDGLSNNVIFDILQDNKGYIWFATNNGLNRYDGYSIKTFFHSKQDSSSISSNVISSIIEDKDGYLWLGTKDGLNRFNKERQNFTTPIKFDDFSLSNKQVLLFNCDTSGKIWMAINDQIGFFDSKSFTIEMIKNFDAFMADITLENENVWISSGYGDIYEYDIDLKILAKKASNIRNNSTHYGASSKSLWVPVGFQSNSRSLPFRRLPKLPNETNPKHLIELDSQIAWLGSDEGLYEYNYETKRLYKIQLGNSTLTKQVRSLYKDKNGGVWVGTLGGVFHYDPYRKVFKHNDIIQDSDDIIMGLHTSKDGIYANALGKGIYFKANNSSGFKALSLPQSFPKQGLFVWDFKTVPESEFPLWMATNSGLICLDPETLGYRKIDVPLNENDENISFSMLDLNQNFLWTASHRAIHKIRKSDRVILDSFSLEEQMKYPGIQKITAFGNYLFIATESNGLLKFDQKAKQFYSVHISGNNKVLSVPIWDLYVFENTLWVGANNGLYSLSLDSLHIEPVLEDNQVIFSIVKDESGVLWLGTDKGIRSYNPSSGETKVYTTIDGLKNIEFNRKSVIKDTLGNLWFGGINGITSFSPELVKKDNPNIPYVYITDFRVATSDSTFSIPRFKHNITLPWKYNTIELDYVGLNYTNPLQNKYRYIMEGHDPNWVSTDKPNTVRYVKLPVGAYNLKLNAANCDGVWNTKGVSLEITIRPPFWRTKTAYLFYILFFLGFLWLLSRLKSYRKRISKVEEEKEIIAKKVEEKFIVLNNKTKVYLKDLKYIKAAGNYLEFYTLDKTFIDRNKLKLLEDQLPPNFIRTHRSFIVNKNYIVSANSSSVIIKPSIETPLSRGFKGILK